MDLALGEGDVDGGGGQGCEDGVTQVTGHPAFVDAGQHAQPEAQGENQGAVGELLEQHQGRRLVEDRGMGAGLGNQDLGDLIDVGPIGHPDGDLPADLMVAVGPVDELLLHQHAVGDQHFHALGGGDGRDADADGADAPADGPDLHQVADPHRPLGEQHDAADQVLQQGLGAKTGGDGQGAPHEGEDLHGDVHQMDAEQDQGGDGDQAQPALAQGGVGRRQPQVLDQQGEDQADRQGNQQIADDQDEDGADAFAHRHAAGRLDLPALDLDGFLDGQQFVVPERRRPELGLDPEVAQPEEGRAGAVNLIDLAAHQAQGDRQLLEVLQTLARVPGQADGGGVKGGQPLPFRRRGVERQLLAGLVGLLAVLVDHLMEVAIALLDPPLGLLDLGGQLEHLGVIGFIRAVETGPYLPQIFMDIEEFGLIAQ